MDAPDFTSFIAEERVRIKAAIKAAEAKRQEAEAEIAQLEAQVAAIAAYDAALKGNKAVTEPRAPRGRRGEKRQASSTSSHGTRTVSPVTSSSTR